MKRPVLPYTLAVLTALACAAGLRTVGTHAQAPTFPPTFPPPNPAAEARLEQLGKRPIHVHDPSSIAECGGQYYLYCTGRGTPSYRSKDLRTWERGPHVFDAPPAWVAQDVPGNSGLDFWAPDIIQVGGQYRLYYAVSTFGKNVSAIGLATSPTLDPADPRYHWTDRGPVIRSGPQDDFNALDPAVSQGPDGRCWLSFGSFWSGIRLVQLDPATGRRLSPASPIHLLAHADSIEAPYIYYHGGYYYLFVNWGYCCRGVDSTYNIRVGRSRSVTGPYLDTRGVDLRRGGGTLFLGSDGPFIGPGHTAILTVDGRDVVSCHFYDATRRGASFLAVRPLTWAADGWPVAGTWPPTGNTAR